MTLEERSNLVVALARVLYVNGQSTDRLWPRPRDSAALSDSSPRSSRAGESWNLRPRTVAQGSSARSRQILPAWIWIVWLPRCVL